MNAGPRSNKGQTPEPSSATAITPVAGFPPPLAIARCRTFKGRMEDLVYKRAVDLLEAELGDEIVGLDVAGDRCFGLNPVAASVWRLLERPVTVPELRRALLAEFEVDEEQCTIELCDLLRELVSLGLVQEMPKTCAPAS